jgi:hypothetical protein
MRAEQFTWKPDVGWASKFPGQLNGSSQLVLAFGGSKAMGTGALMEDVRRAFPKAHILGCSTAGEIAGTEVFDDSFVVTAAAFEQAHLAGAQVDLVEARDSFDAGVLLAGRFDTRELVHVLVMSDGLKVNGSQLVRGLAESLPAGVGISGGLSADGARFEKTLVCFDDGAREGRIAAVGFYGDRLKVSCASRGGWDTFGPERRVTRSKGNVLYELDGRSALELYKQYLGEYASALPASGLLFPLSIRGEGGTDALVRTILSVDEREQSMTFAGDMPQGATARLMRANFERLIDGAQDAASATQTPGNSRDAQGAGELALLISCVGRKLVLKQRVEEEVEAVGDVLGRETVMAGFYSYGEISPFTPAARCELHNQTMTITTFSEQ